MKDRLSASDARKTAALAIVSGATMLALARHAWDEPCQRIVAARERKSYRLLTPMIGEVITQLAFYAGWPRAFSAAAVVKGMDLPQ